MFKKEKQKTVIIAPREGFESQDEYFKEKWKNLNKSIELIYDEQSETLLYEEQFRNVYYLVFNGHGLSIYNNLCEIIKQRLIYLNNIISKSRDDEFFKTLSETWEKFKNASISIRDIFMYLDQHFIDDNSKKPIYSLSVSLFREEIIERLKLGEKISKEISKRIKLERSGAKINHRLMKNISEMLNEIGSYSKVSEQTILELSRDFYSEKALKIINNITVPEYLIEVEKYLKIEKKRVSDYLLQSTLNKLEKIIQDKMISKHMNHITEDNETGFISLVKKDKIIDIKRMFDLFSFNNSHLEKLIERFKIFILNTGKRYVLDDDLVKQPISYVEKLVFLKEKFVKILTKSFSNHLKFQEAYRKGFEGFADGVIQKKTAENISLFIDNTMKKYSKNDSKLQENVKHAINLFDFLQDKDVFENYYKIHLSKRLLLSRKMNQPQKKAEEMFITELKHICGFHFTSKIEGMFNDMKRSKKTVELFKKHKTHEIVPDNIDIHANILTSSFWPSYNLSRCILPNQMKQCCQAFEKYYNDAHCGRTINWQSNLGDGLLIGRYAFSKHELIASTYQMVVLLLFNDVNKLTYKQIKTKTDIPDKDLKRCLLTLFIGKNKLLTKEPKNPKEILDDDIFTWNVEFSSKEDCLRLHGVIVVKDSSNSNKKILSKLDSEKFPKIEQSLMKIMKIKKKNVNIKILIEDVKNDLKQKFNLTTMEIKKRMESLIEREFLERNKDDRKSIDLVQ